MQSLVKGFNPNYAEDTPTLAELQALSGKAVLEFGTSWCGHCQAAQPAVHTILSQNPTLPHIKVADGKGKKLGRAFSVKLWPTLILLNDGIEVARVVRPRHHQEISDLLSQPC